MKALTVWQPWASLIVLKAKPWEFRGWDYRSRYKSLEGERIVIHAGARPVKRHEILDLVARIREGSSALDEKIAMPLMERLLAASDCSGVLELSAGLGTAVLGRPRPVGQIFRGADSDRLDHSLYGWPLTQIEPFDHPIPCRGAQGFWNWRA